MWKRRTDGNGKGTHRRKAAAVSSRCGNGRQDGKPVAEERLRPAEKAVREAEKRGRGAAWSKKVCFFDHALTVSALRGISGAKSGGVDGQRHQAALRVVVPLHCQVRHPGRTGQRTTNFSLTNHLTKTHHNHDYLYRTGT